MNRQHIKCIISTHSLTRRLTTFPDGTKKTIDISTHSLTRRLTAFLGYQRSRIWHFNSQPHKEADSIQPCACLYRIISTHSLTRRLTKTIRLNYISIHFNSQPHKEADDWKLFQIDWIDISTHSLTRRLTAIGFLDCIRTSYFNSQPHKEADGTFAILDLSCC